MENKEVVNEEVKGKKENVLEYTIDEDTMRYCLAEIYSNPLPAPKGVPKFKSSGRISENDPRLIRRYSNGEWVPIDGWGW